MLEGVRQRVTVIIDFINWFVAVPELMREFLQRTTMLSGRAFGRVPGKLAVPHS